MVSVNDSFVLVCMFSVQFKNVSGKKSWRSCISHYVNGKKVGLFTLRKNMYCHQ